MGSKITRKITDALSELLEGYTELLESLEDEYPTDDIGDVDSNDELDIESSLITEVRAALELVMESEDYSPDDIASLITSMTEALEEIDPSIFEQEEGEEEDDDDDYIVDDEDDFDDYEEEDDDFDFDDEDTDDLDE